MCKVMEEHGSMTEGTMPIVSFLILLFQIPSRYLLQKTQTKLAFFCIPATIHRAAIQSTCLLALMLTTWLTKLQKAEALIIRATKAHVANCQWLKLRKLDKSEKKAFRPENWQSSMKLAFHQSKRFWQANPMFQGSK